MSWVPKRKSYYVDNTVIGFTVVGFLTTALLVDILSGSEQNIIPEWGTYIQLTIGIIWIIISLTYLFFILFFITYYGWQIPFYSAYATMLFHWVFNPIQRGRRLLAFQGRDIKHRSIWHLVLLFAITLYIYYALNQSGVSVSKESAQSALNFYKDLLFLSIPVAVGLVSYISGIGTKHQIFRYKVGGLVPIVFLVISSGSVLLVYLLTLSSSSDFQQFFSSFSLFALALAFLSLIYPFAVSMHVYRRDESGSIYSYTKRGIVQSTIPEIQIHLMVKAINNRTPQNVSCRLDKVHDDFDALVMSQDILTEGEYIRDVNIRKLREALLELDGSTEFLLVLPIEKESESKNIPVISCRNPDQVDIDIDGISVGIGDSIQTSGFERISQDYDSDSYYQGLSDLEKGCKSAIDNQNPLKLDHYLSKYGDILDFVDRIENSHWNDTFETPHQFDFSPVRISILNITSYIREKEHVHQKIIRKVRKQTGRLETAGERVNNPNIKKQFEGICSDQESIFEQRKDR